MINIDHELGICVKAIGGSKVSDLVGMSPNFKNADYIFHEYNVVSELKSLEEDKISDPRIRDKASKIYGKFFKKGQVPNIGFGTTRISTEGYPDDFVREIIELYKIPVLRVVRDAEFQIQETKKHLNYPNANGLLILVNEGNTALNPYNVRWIMNDIFQNNELSSINSLLYFTASLQAEHPAIDKNLLVWVTHNRSEKNKCPDQLFDRLHNQWRKHFSELIGVPIDIIEAKDHNIIDEINNK